MAQGSVPSRTDDVSLLVITLETNPYNWDKHGTGATFSIHALLEQVRSALELALTHSR